MDLWTALCDLALPRSCVHCRVDLPRGRPGPLCAPCGAALPPPPVPACVRCAGRRASRSPLCLACSGRLHACRFVRSTAAHAGPAASLVHAFKFRGLRGAAVDAGRRMARARALLPELEGFDAVVPVPAHPDRQRERGYNQARLLAESAAFQAPLCDALERRRGGVASWTLGRERRETSLRGAYAVESGREDAIRGRRVLLVDDVCATGTTLEECARALRRAGAVDVAGWTFTRAGST